MVVEAAGARFTDLDGHTYLDVNLGDTSVLAGWAHPVVLRAASERLALGGQFLLPTDDAVHVARALAVRCGRPRWRFTLSATQANVEVVRICRAATGRPVLLMFDGKYHGHADELLLGGLERIGPEVRGVTAAAADVRVVAFNDLEALERALAPGDVACVLSEPALTNAGVVQPEPGFWDGVRAACDAAGTPFVLDETHTAAAGPGGLTALWGLAPDAVTLGKGLAGGLPFGAYGLSEALADAMLAGDEEVASGGTLYANALGMAVARAFLADEVLTPGAHERANALATRLADGIEERAAAHGLGWRAHRLLNRSGLTHAPELPRDAAQAAARFDRDLWNLQRLHLANRGVWEAIDSAGPAVSLAATAEDVETYLAAFDAFLGELT